MRVIQNMFACQGQGKRDRVSIKNDQNNMIAFTLYILIQFLYVIYIVRIFKKKKRTLIIFCTS